MSGDQLVYQMASSPEGSANIFLRKDWLNILDQQNGQYTGNQSVIDTSQLANSNKYMNYREAYLTVPMMITATGTAIPAPATAATSCDYLVGLKNWFGSVIHSFTLEMQGTTIVQQTPFIGLWNTFKLMTTLSWADVQTVGSSIGFYPDSALSVFSQAAVSTDGIGTCNNKNLLAFPVVSGTLNSYDSGNAGLLRRQQFINYDPDGLTDAGAQAYSTMLTGQACSALYKSYVINKTNGATGTYQIACQAQIRLKDLHSFFQSVPLLKGMFFKFTLNLNQPQVQISVTDTTRLMTLTQNINPLGGVNPLMIASATTSNGAATMAATGSAQLYVSLAIGNRATWSAHSAGSLTTGPNSSISLNVPAYCFSPVFEQAYLAEPVKKVVYTDVYQYNVNGVAAGSTFNNLITNGIAGLKSVLVLPYFTSTANGGVSPIQSPYDPAGAGPTSPLCLLNNFNVVVSGQNAIYNTQKYSYEAFMNQLYGCNAVNAGMTDGLTSSLIGQLDFETEYCYHYVNVSRMPAVDEAVPKSVQIQGQNQSARAVDLYVFCEYGVEISIDVLRGLRV